MVYISINLGSGNATMGCQQLGMCEPCAADLGRHVPCAKRCMRTNAFNSNQPALTQHINHTEDTQWSASHSSTRHASCRTKHQVINQNITASMLVMVCSMLNTVPARHSIPGPARHRTLHCHKQFATALVQRQATTWGVEQRFHHSGLVEWQCIDASLQTNETTPKSTH